LGKMKITRKIIGFMVIDPVIYYTLLQGVFPYFEANAKITLSPFHISPSGKISSLNFTSIKL